MSALSEQYAVALFEVASDADVLNDVLEEYDALKQGLDDASMQFFMHPGVEKTKKRDLIDSLNVSETLQHFLYVLIDNNRFEYVPDIYEDYKALINNRFKRMHVIVYSKRPLDAKRKENLKQQYEAKYNRQVTLENRLDEKIVGGLRFEFEGKVIDDTINHTLSQMKRQLTK